MSALAGRCLGPSMIQEDFSPVVTRRNLKDSQPVGDGEGIDALLDYFEQKDAET